MSRSDLFAKYLVYAMFGISLLYLPFELWGPLQFKSLQIERGYDPDTLLGFNTGEFAFAILVFGNSIALKNLFAIIQAGRNGESMLQKKFKLNVTLAYITAFATTFIPMALWYFMLPPDGWTRSGWLFAADCVLQGRFWWGMIMCALGSLYINQCMQKYHPEQLQP